MAVVTPGQAAAALALLLLGCPLLPVIGRAPGPLHPEREEIPFTPASPFVRASRRTPTDQALREAAAWETLAKQVVADVGYRLDAWDASASETAEARHWRNLAYDSAGYLRRARRAAQHASALARSRAEAVRAAQMLVRLECLVGRHRAELQEAHRLATLAPGTLGTWHCLQHAVRCRRQEIPDATRKPGRSSRERMDQRSCSQRRR